MAGGESCATASEKAAGEGSTRPTKRKAEEEDVADEHLPHPLKYCCVTGDEWEDDSAAGAGSAATPATMAGEEKKHNPPWPENRMSTGQIRWILNYKPIHWPRKLLELRESNPSLVPLPGEEKDDAKMKLYSQANEVISMDERYIVLQERVRHELETKGYVEMDEDEMRRKAECDAIEEESMKKLEDVLPYLTVEEDDDDDESDDDDEFYF